MYIKCTHFIEMYKPVVNYLRQAEKRFMALFFWVVAGTAVPRIIMPRCYGLPKAARGARHWWCVRRGLP